MDLDREMFSVVPRGDKRSIKEIQDEEDLEEMLRTFPYLRKKEEVIKNDERTKS